MREFSGDEQRKFVRISVEVPVRLRLGASEVPYEAAFACDISTGGLGLVVRGEYPDSFDALTVQKDPVDIEIDLPNGRTLSVRAEVVWGHPDEQDGETRFRVGLRFTALGPRERDILESVAKSSTFDYLFPRNGGSGGEDA